MVKIKSIRARKILDARGYPALLVLCEGEKGRGQSSVASEYSWHNNYGRNGVKEAEQAVDMAIGIISGAMSVDLAGRKFKSQSEFDDVLENYFSDGGMEPFSFAVSLAFARLASSSSQDDLFAYLRSQAGLKGKIKSAPLPLSTMFNGGMIADTNLDFQEFLFIPKRRSPLVTKIMAAGNSEANAYIALSASVYRELGLVLQEAGYDSDTGLQGGYAPDMESSLSALEMIMAAASRVGLEAGRDFSLGIDIGSFTLYDPESGKYLFALDQSSFVKDDMIGLYNSWLSKFPIEYLEDALAGENWEAWRDLTASLGSGVVIAGDEIFSSRQDKLRAGFKEQAANAIVIKPDKTGSITATANICALAKRHGYGVVMSQRSSETSDDALADMAVAYEAQFIKAGATARGERIAKYNRLLEIFEIMKEKDGKR